MTIPAIYQCPNGHSCCSTCRSKLTRCPECRVEYTQARNITLERLLEKVPMCKFEGCGFTATDSDNPELLVDHEKDCLRNIVQNPDIISTRLHFRGHPERTSHLNPDFLTPSPPCPSLSLLARPPWHYLADPDSS